jgi:SAM-dependent methyltransferase
LGIAGTDAGANSPDDLDLTFVEGDMRSFDLGRRFPLVIVSCNSLAHLITNDELKACFSTVLRHLAPGGLFAFDIVNPDVRALARDTLESVRLDLGPNRSSGIAVEETSAYDPVRQVRILSWRVREPMVGVREVAPLPLRRSSRRSCRCCWRRRAWSWPPATATFEAIR